jgi:chloramphenicol O-acetyltransferase
MRIIGVYLLFITSITLTQAQTYPTKPVSTNNLIEELQILLENEVKKINFNIENQKASFPSYSEAFNLYQKETQLASKRFIKRIKSTIENYNEARAKQVQELKAVEKLASNHPDNKAIVKTYHLKQKSYREAIKKIDKQINEQYKKALGKLYQLEGRLIYPVKLSIGGQGFWAWLGFGAFKVATGGAIALAITLPPAGAFTLGLLATFSDLTYSNWLISDGPINKDEFRMVYSDGHEYTFDAHDRNYYEFQFAKQLYKECQTAGCVYLMEENYAQWIELISKKINKTLTLPTGLKLKKVMTKTSKRHRKLKSFSDKYAKKLPEAIYSEEQ